MQLYKNMKSSTDIFQEFWQHVKSGYFRKHVKLCCGTLRLISIGQKCLKWISHGYNILQKTVNQLCENQESIRIKKNMKSNFSQWRTKQKQLFIRCFAKKVFSRSLINTDVVPQRCHSEKNILEIYCKFTEEQPCRSVISINLL